MSEIGNNVNAPAALTLVPNTQTPDGPLQMRGGYSTTAWNTETKSTNDPCPYGWRNNLRTTIYAYANGYYEVRATRQSDTSTIPLILLGTPPEYETRILGGMVRCIKDN